MLKKYSFGIDIDGTVTTQEFMVPYINDYFKTNVTLEDFTEYNLLKVLPIDPKAFEQWFLATEIEMYTNPPLQQHALQTLQKWHPHACLNYITARQNNSLDVTNNWFKRHQLPVDTLNIVGNASKVLAAKEHGVELFFEDKYENAIQLNEELNIPIILFDAPYNRLALPKDVIRVHDWQEAEQWVAKEFGI